MAPWRWSFRAVYLGGFLVCAALMAYALYAEYHLGLAPCPLCIFQRIAFLWMGVWFLVGGLHAPRGKMRWFYCVLVLLGAAWGIAVAARHLYLQGLPPDQVPSCGPGLNYMLQTFPFAQTLKLVFEGSGECAQVNWKFLGLSMPGWTLIWYVLLAVFAIRGAARRSPRRPA
ncbi:MAG: disulfide bond formation protein B [Proteobacteria bacterium]|nr:disulfide bond formation protein B [Pseudomonadota bacterium]